MVCSHNMTSYQGYYDSLILGHLEALLIDFNWSLLLTFQSFFASYVKNCRQQVFPLRKWLPRDGSQALTIRSKSNHLATKLSFQKCTQTFH